MLRFALIMAILLFPAACMAAVPPKAAPPKVNPPVRSSSVLSDEPLTEGIENAGLAGTGSGPTLTFGNLRLSIIRLGGQGFRESYQVRTGKGQWVEVLVSSEGKGGSDVLAYAMEGKTISTGTPAYDRVVPGVNGNGLPQVRLHLETEAYRLEKTITVDPVGPAFHVRVEFHPRVPLLLRSLESRYGFSPANRESPPDFVWTPCLRPERDDVIADHCFRSPALIVAKDGIVCSLIPDLDLILSGEEPRKAMDLDCNQSGPPLLSYGFVPWRTRGHVYFKREKTAKEYDDRTNLTYGFYLLLRSGDNGQPPYRDTVRFLWHRFARPRLAAGPKTLRQPLEAWEEEAFGRYASNVYLPVDLPGLSGGILKSERARWTNEKTNNDAWFSARFQSVRTACGMYRYGSVKHDPEGMERAVRAVDLILSAPQRKGIYPSIFCLSEDRLSGEWLLDSGWAGYADSYHAFDASWTGCWLLEFAELVRSYTPRILEFLVPYADFLLEHQRADGCIPSFYDARTLEPRADRTPHFMAECAGSALFLARLYQRVDNSKYLDGACRAMDVVSEAISPNRLWSDFETYLTASRKPFGFVDPHTLQPAQSTLCMIQAAWGYLALHAITEQERYLELGERVLDYLSLYQQVWSPPFFKATLFGGFGVQNTGAEWSDARGAYIASLYFDYFSATGKQEFFERGVSALWACFGVAPHQNWAQNGQDGPGSVAGIHWGMGSAAVTSIIQRERFGDIFIDLEGGWGLPLNAFLLENLRIDGFKVSFTLAPSAGVATTGARVKFTGQRFGVYELEVNGKNKGSTSAPELKKGLFVAFH